ncbi:MAG: hypothetical protein WC736_15125 [Gallionella sp.]|jgi:hypothetical protein
MKVSVLVDLAIECDPPSHIWRYSSTIERRANRLEEWVNEFNSFIRDHRSQDGITLTVKRVMQDQCGICGRDWEEDSDGPLCCNDAQEEWLKSRTIIEPPK